MDEFESIDSLENMDTNTEAAPLDSIEMLDDIANSADTEAFCNEEFAEYVKENIDSMSRDELTEAKERLEEMRADVDPKSDFYERIDSMSLDELNAERDKLLELKSLYNFESVDDTSDDDDNPPVLARTLRR